MLPDRHSEKYVYSRVTTLELGGGLSYHSSVVVLLFKDSVQTIRCAARNIYNFDSVEFTDALALCPNLTEVDGVVGNAMSDGMLQRLVKKCPRLSGLGVGGGSNLTDMSFVRDCSSQLPLRRIDFSGSSLTGVSVMAVLAAHSESQFERIAVAHCRKVNDELALKLAQSSAMLTDLNIAGTEISAVGLKAVLCGCLSLVTVNISALTGALFVVASAADYRVNCNLTWMDVSGTALCNQGLEIVAMCYPRLQHLDMHDCSGATDEGVRHLAGSLTALTFLDVAYSSTRPSYPAIVVPLIDQALADLVRSNPGMQTLKLARRVNSIAPLSSALEASNGLLTVLNLAKCAGITDGEVVELTRVSPALRVVDLTDCPALTDVVLTALVTNCGELREVSLTGCRGLSLAGMADFAKTCSKLVKLTH